MKTVIITCDRCGAEIDKIEGSLCLANDQLVVNKIKSRIK